jgi:hypothetical protein
MAKNTIADLDTTAANNTDILGQNSAGSASANTIDTLFQNENAVLARYYGDEGGLGTIGGSANAITVTSRSTYQSLTTGLHIRIKPAANSTSTVTLNLDGLGARAVRLPGDVALSAGELRASGYYDLNYDTALNGGAGAWTLLNPSYGSTYQPLDTDLTKVAATGVAAFSGMLWGLTLSNNGTDATNDIDIAAGTAIDSTNAQFMTLASALTKRLDATWSVGTGNGGLDTGTIANATYHVWLIMRSDTGVVDALFSTSATSPTMPANYDFRRRIGSIVRASATIRAFAQIGDVFTWSVPIQDISALNPGTSAVTATLSVPTGIVVRAEIVAQYLPSNSYASDSYMLVTALTQTNSTPSSSLYHLVVQVDNNAGVGTGVSLLVATNTSGQIRYRVSQSDAALTVNIITIGWIDTRGRLAA